MTKRIAIGKVKVGGKSPLVLVAGPCVIESRAGCLELAKRLKKLSDEMSIPLVFKASYDKANRTSHTSFRGPGMEKGLQVLREVAETTGLPVLTDVHQVQEVEPVAKVVQAIQIPAFLCRQTDLILAAGATGLPVNVKKGQFLAPWDMENIVRKLEETGNRKILLTERGTTFGYNNLVVDMRGLVIMRDLGYPVIFDATHSVQKPGGAGTASSGDGDLVPVLARAAVAAGCDAVFLETHLKPEKALSDRDNAIPYSNVRKLWNQLVGIHAVLR